jgi:ketosteroid isomerase-like protein
MSPHDLIESFYRAFAALDAEAMAACYHDEVRFEDPAFGPLQGEQARSMWRMLCQSQQGKAFVVTYSDIRTEGERGWAHWEARYEFGGRPVHNRIEASFVFQDGKIIEHTDRFDLYRWARQALGFQGWLLGWPPFYRKQLQGKTNGRLKKFEAKLRG